MGTKGLVSLGLRTVGAGVPEKETEAAVCRRLLDEALAILTSVVEAAGPAPIDVTSALSKSRQGITTGVAAAVLAPLVTESLTMTGRFAAGARVRATEERTQVAALLGMVQEAVAMLTGNQTTLEETLTGSADRFARLATVNNVREIQAQLVREVTTLKRITLERRTSWEQTFQEFGARLSGLETQLDSTRREAAVDPLTNIANRRTFERTCQQLMGASQPRFVMGMIDVDDFKTINDRHGHAVGDRVLVAIAETLSRSFRSDDLVARLGGDEFAVLATSLSLAQAHSRFGAIIKVVKQACREILPDFATTVSTGLAEFSGGDTAGSLQERADLALYEAKRQGKGWLVAKESPFTRDLLKGRNGSGAVR
jgi:diguanylate cyclase (GGDEF)-like protein